MTKTKCIAYNTQGNICGAPATQIDKQRGGMVCDQHAPTPGAPPPAPPPTPVWRKNRH